MLDLTKNIIVKGPNLVPFESGQITIVLRQIDRVAKIEAGEPSVSVDLQIRSLLALGASKEELAEAIRS